ncbi:hypothetical protein BDW68DRAFT_158614 [Aspergillus falconensis]
MNSAGLSSGSMEGFIGSDWLLRACSPWLFLAPSASSSASILLISQSNPFKLEFLPLSCDRILSPSTGTSLPAAFERRTQVT